MENKFFDTFKYAPTAFFSAPGRTEIGGNHTDHQNGRVLAAAVDVETTAAVGLNNTNTINIMSEGFGQISVDLTDLAVKPEDYNTTVSLVRGVAAWFAENGADVKGFDAYVTSNVLPGSGLSSSAAYEVLIGNIINNLFYESKADPIKIAQIAQYTENVYFGKPCGLMDQMASSVGNIITVDFEDKANPVVKRLDYDFNKSEHDLFIINSGAGHENLTHEYAAIPGEMKSVAAYFGKEVLRQVNKSDFLAELVNIRKQTGDRAVLRALHYFDEDIRVVEEINALSANNFDEFLKVFNRSAESSWIYLQNVTPKGADVNQEMAIALALCRSILSGKGGVRVHGGGFAGTIQAFVPKDMSDTFKKETDKVLGDGYCMKMNINPFGGRRIK